MNICVAGWYFDPALIALLGSDAFWVCHKQPPKSIPADRMVVIPNVGLEFGCYNWYLNNKWGSGSCLFIHDDEGLPPDALRKIKLLPNDQAFLFSSVDEASANGNAHGRAIFASDKLLTRLKADGGFWFDESPMKAKEIPATASDTPAYHNLGILTFRAWLRSLPKSEFDVEQIVIVPGLKNGYRGRL